MKIQTTILLAIAFTFYWAPKILYAQSTHANVTLHGKTKMKQIFTNIGMPYVILQYCDTSMAPELRAGQFSFEHTWLGKIKDVRMIYELKRDTIETITLFLENETEREQAIKQAEIQFGASHFSQNNMISIHTWQTTTNGLPISISLVYTEHEPTSELLIKEINSN